MEELKASEEDWRQLARAQELYSDISDGYGIRCILELRDRVAALEARELVSFTVQNETGQYIKAGTPVYATPPAEQQATVKESLTVEPAPADPDTPQSLHDVALVYVDSLGRSFGILPAILDTIRRAIREPMAAPAEPGRVATDEELREAWELAPAPGGIFNSNYCLRAVYNLGRQHGAACPYIRSSDEGTSYCALAEQPAPAAPVPDPAPPATAGGLVEAVEEALRKEDWLNSGYDPAACGDDDPDYRYTSAAANDGLDVQAMQARAAINVIAKWLRSVGSGYADELEQEATR